VYAIVKAGGRQEKVAVGDTVFVDHIDAAAGSTVTFPVLLVVDGAADPYSALQEQDWLSSSSRFPF